MKYFKNGNNELFGFEDDCFDEEGKCNNEYASKVIQENKLIEITEEEARELSKPVITKEQLIVEINQKAYNEITFIYPEWKQANIQSDFLQYPDNDIFKKNFEEMRLYINQIRANADLEVMKLD